MARSRRRGQQGRRKVGAGKRHRQKPRQAVRQGQPATPKIPASNSKSHLLYLHSNGGLSSPNTPVALPLTPCVCQIFILRIGSQDLLISMRAAAGPSAANECKDQARHQSRLDGCPEGPLQQGNRLKSAWKSEHQGTQEDTKTPEVPLTRKAEREEAGAEKGAHRTLSIVADTNRNQLWKGSAKRNYQLVKWQNEWVRERERERRSKSEWETTSERQKLEDLDRVSAATAIFHPAPPVQCLFNYGTICARCRLLWFYAFLSSSVPSLTLFLCFFFLVLAPSSSSLLCDFLHSCLVR